MEQVTSRRGFLRLLGMGGAVAVASTAAAATGYHVAADPGVKGGEKTAFNFMCMCGSSIVAEVPTEVGSVVEVPCECGKQWKMEWQGDHFSAKETYRHYVEETE